MALFASHGNCLFPWIFQNNLFFTNHVPILINIIKKVLCFVVYIVKYISPQISSKLKSLMTSIKQKLRALHFTKKSGFFFMLHHFWLYLSCIIFCSLYQFDKNLSKKNFKYHLPHQNMMRSIEKYEEIIILYLFH